MEKQTIPFRLTPTVAKIQKKLSEEEELTSLYIIQLLSSLHAEYGQQKYPDFASVSTTQHHPFDEWLRLASSHFIPDKVEEFHGRLLLIGLALSDPDLSHILLNNEFLQLVAGEVREEMEIILTSESYQYWQGLLGTPKMNKHFSPDNVPTHSDHPTINDELGRRAFARSLARRIERVRTSEDWPQAEKTAAINVVSFVVGKIIAFIERLFSRDNKGEKLETTHSGAFMMHIHGPWGSGKTTLINFIRDELGAQKEDDRWLSIYFNAWKYQRLGPPWWALTKEIYLQSLAALNDADSSESDHYRAKHIYYNENWNRIFTGWGPWMIAAGLLLWATSSGHIDFLSNIGKVFTLGGSLLAASQFVLTGSARGTSAIMEISGDPMRPLVKRFDQLVVDTGHPLVIFIDDLDRCDAEYVIKVLHGIQTMYWRTQVAYVVAADRHWLRAAYEKSYSEFSDYVGEPGRPIGYLFLEKLFQISTPVPQLDPEQSKQFWHSLIGLNTEDVETKLDKLRNQAAEELSKLKTEEDILNTAKRITESEADPLYIQAFREESVVRLSAKDIEDNTEHTLKAFSNLLEPNPRAMKRMVNAYGVRRANDMIKGGSIDRATLALWIIVELRWPLLAEYLTEHPETIDNIRERKPPEDEDLDADLKKLFATKEVLKVIDGNAEGIEVQLTKDSINECTGHRPALPINGSMA